MSHLPLRPTTPSSPTKPSRPHSFALPSRTNATEPPSSPNLSRRSTHRATPSLSSLQGLSLGTGTSSSGGGSSFSPTMVNSPTFASLTMERSATSGSSSTSSSGGWGGFAFAERAKAVGWEAEDMQNKVFCKWLNARLEPQGYPPVTNLGADFRDGTRLIQLIEVLTEQSLGRFNREPNHRVQMFENAKQALDKIKEMGVHLTNIGAEDIVDGNRKLILGMIWSLVLRFSIADIQEEGSHAKEGLLLWCQRKTQSYEGVNVENFSRSFQDGLAFCALIHRHRPDLLDWDSISKNPKDAADNLRLAFKVADEHLGIPQLLDVEDVCGAKKPDERSVMTYIAQYFHAFSSSAQAETEARVISNFVENVSSLMIGVHDYERRVGLLLEAISTRLSQWSSMPPVAPLTSLDSSRAELDAFRLTIKREWINERGDVTALLLNVQTKLKTYGLKGYTPGEPFRIEDIEGTWNELLEAESNRSRQINKLTRQVQEGLRHQVADLTNSTYSSISDLSYGLASCSGPLEIQLETLRALLVHLPSLKTSLVPLAEAERALLAARVELTDNDYTVHSYEHLSFELERLTTLVNQRKSFVENQIVARKTTSLPPEQLEEFESAFKAFDKEGTNRLGVDELLGALGALGISEVNLDEIRKRRPRTSFAPSEDLPEDGEVQVSFEEFMRFLVARSEDRLTGDKVRSCFRSVGANKGYVTELDLTRLELPSTAVSFLRDHMQRAQFEDGEEGGDEGGAAFDFEEFLDTFLEE